MSLVVLQPEKYVTIDLLQIYASSNSCGNEGERVYLCQFEDVPKLIFKCK